MVRSSFNNGIENDKIIIGLARVNSFEKRNHDTFFIVAKIKKKNCRLKNISTV